MFREKLFHQISKDYGDSLADVRNWRYDDILRAVTFYKVENEINNRSMR